MKYPENERILVMRPCLKTFCLGNKPASKLLSLLLYYARHVSDDAPEFVFMSTQEALVDDLLDEIDVKTLHRTAIPLLKLLGFLDVDGACYRYQYTVHLDLVRHLLANYKNKREVGRVIVISMIEQLDKLPIEQKDTFPIVFDRRELDKCLKEIDKCPIQLDKLPIQLEECLIPFRQMSNSKRGRKPRFRAVWSDEFLEPQMDRDITDRYEITEEREGVVASAPTAPAFPEPEYHFYGTEQQHLIWNCQNWCAVNSGTCADYVAAIAAGLHESPTDKMPAVPPNVTPVSHSQLSIPDGYMQGEPSDGHLSQPAHPDVGHLAATGERGAVEMSEQGDAAGGCHTDTGRGGPAVHSAARVPGTVRHDAALDRGVEAPSRARAVPETTETQDIASQQTISGLSPGAAPARHSGQASDGAASTAPPRSGPRASGKRNGKAHEERVPIPQEAFSILDDWDSLFKKPVARTQKHIQSALDLVPCHPSKDDLKACKGWLFTTDNPQKPWFKKIGVKLRDVADNFGAWQSVQPGEPTEDELEPYSIPWFLAQQARRQAQELQA